MSDTSKWNIISIPVHPDELDVPVSLVHIPISGGRYVVLQGPLAPKTMTALQGTLEACRDILVAKPPEIGDAQEEKTHSNFPTPQCSSGASQSRPDSARPVKGVASAGHLQQPGERGQQNSVTAGETALHPSDSP